MSNVLQVAVVLAVLTAVVLLVTAPLRRAPAGPLARDAGPARENERERADLEAAREAKYREIRDAELDHQLGKLSDADYAAVDQGLRAEAVEIIHALDRTELAAGAPAATIPEP